MKKLRHLVFAIALIFSVSYSSFATTWAPVEVTCPVCKHKNNFMAIMSFGSYIYHWPEKYQYIYWPMTDDNVLYSCQNCHYTAFMGEFEEVAKEKIPQIKEMLAKQTFKPQKYAKYTDEPMSQRLAIAEKVYEVLAKDDDWWCRFERIRGYHLAAEKNAEQAAVARKKALALAEKMLKNRPKDLSEKELLLISGGMKFFLNDREGALKDLERAQTLKFTNPEIEKEKAEGFDGYLSEVIKEFIEGIKDPEKAKKLRLVA